MRSFLSTSILLSLTSACGLRADKEEESAPAADVTAVPSVVYDLDGNGIEDVGNQSYAFGQSDAGATFVVFLGATLPQGSATNVSMSLRGYGSEEYSDEEYGWDTNFLPLPDARDADGDVVGYGVAGLRDGTYEFNCARTDASVGTLDGWCKPSNTKPADDLRFLVEIINGDETCPRLDKNWGITVLNGVVFPTGESFARPDETCY